MIRWLTEKQRFTVTSTTVIHGESFARIDANSYLRRRVVGIFTRLRQNVDDLLCYGDGFLNSGGLGIVRLGHH